MFKTSRNRNSVKIVLDFTGFLRLLGNNSVIPLLTAAKKAPFLSPETARTAGRSGRPDAEKRQAFLLLSRRGVQNRQILPILACSTFAAFPLSTEPAALGFGRIFWSPARRRNVRFWVSGGYAPGCARKIGHSRDTRLTRADRRFSAAPVGTLTTAFGCVPAHTPRPILQVSARKTAGWRTEWAGAYTKGFRSACVRPV